MKKNKEFSSKTYLSSFLVLLSLIFFNASCSDNPTNKTSNDKKTKLEHGDFVKFHYKLTYKDSVIMSTYSTIPAFDQVDSIGRFHDFSEILPLLEVGDSAVCIMNYDTLQKSSQFGVPSFMKKGDKLVSTIKILAVYKTKGTKSGRDYAVEDYQAEMNKFKAAEMAAIKKYLDVKKINATNVNNNLYVLIEKEGTGPQADSGKTVGVKYSGSNFEGQYFDSNTDSTRQLQKHPMDVFYFVAKEQGAIQGMLEGITLFKQGSKGKMFIPSTFGYGPQGSPPAIKANENLIFEVEVVEVKDTPKNTGEQMMPPGAGGN